MTTQTTVVNTAGSNTWTAPTTLIGGTVTVSVYGAQGDGEPVASQAPSGWPQGTTNGGHGSLIKAVLTLAPGAALTFVIGDAVSHGQHIGGTGSAGLNGGQTGFHGGGSTAVLSGATVLVEAPGGGAAGGNAFTGFGSAKGGYGGKTPSAGYSGSVTPHATTCSGGGGAGGGGHQGVGANGLNAHTGKGGTTPGAAGDSGLNSSGYAAGGGSGEGGTTFVATTGVSSVSYVDAAGNSTLGYVSVAAKVADAPLAPVLTSPYNGVYVNSAAAVVVFGWTYAPATDSGTQQSYALRVALDGGAYQYWNATSNAFQATIVWNASTGHSVTLPAGAIPNGHVVTWSIATAETHYGLQGAFASNFSFKSGTTYKWQLVDPVTAEAYSFEINPNSGGSLPLQKQITSYSTTADDSQIVLYEGADTPQQVQVSGTLLTQGQYNNMVYWYSKRRQVLLIDDLGRLTWVYFAQWQPTRKWTYQSPWRHDWQAQFFVVGQQAVTAQ
jgi:hypothetical protein